MLRLGPADFVGGSAPPHEPVVQIDDEARPVLVAPEVITVTEKTEQRPASGVLHLPVTLPARAAVLPDAAFLLTAKRQDFRPGEDEIVIANTILHGEQMVDWQLVRKGPGARETIVEARIPPHLGERFSLHLRARAPTPARLASRRFSVAAASRLVLRWGLAGGTRTRPARFRAWLACRGHPTRRILRERLTPGHDRNGAWRETIVSFPRPLADCRLVLRHDTWDGDGAHGLWSPPYFLGVEAAPSPPPNVVLISLDTLRGDHLSGYGYGRPTSPAIDARLIDRGTAFVEASTTFPLTNVAHMSLFTGLYADAQPDRYTVPPDSRVTMLTESLRDAGFETAAYTEDAGVAGAFGFWHGFGRFTERAFVDAARGRDTFRDGARFVRAHRDRRFFLFLHTYKVHAPYTSSPAYAGFFDDPAARPTTVAPAVPPEHRDAMDRYDRAIREVDDQVAAFLDVLEDTGLADRTLVVLLSDHGEAFGEHGVIGHGLGGHQEQLNVPLVFRGPGVRIGRVETPVSLVDVAPTLLELTGARPLAQGQGQSLRPALVGQPLPADRPIFFGWIGGRAAGVRVDAMKYLAGKGGGQLFDLARDPGETHPLATDVAPFATLVAQAHEHHANLRERLGAAGQAQGGTVVSPKVEESLRALGYL